MHISKLFGVSAAAYASAASLQALAIDSSSLFGPERLVDATNDNSSSAIMAFSFGGPTNKCDGTTQYLKMTPGNCYGPINKKASNGQPITFKVIDVNQGCFVRAYTDFPCQQGLDHKTQKLAVESVCYDPASAADSLSVKVICDEAPPSSAPPPPTLRGKALGGVVNPVWWDTLVEYAQHRYTSGSSRGKEKTHEWVRTFMSVFSGIAHLVVGILSIIDV